jgi:hypothetical protein
MKAGDIPSDEIDGKSGWKTLADRIRKIDPNRCRSYELHLEVMREV